jgi:hypothetical protein
MRLELTVPADRHREMVETTRALAGALRLVGVGLVLVAVMLWMLGGAHADGE